MNERKLAALISVTENVVSDDKDERNANKARHLHLPSNAGDVIAERTVSSDRKRKCSNGDDDVLACRRRQSNGDDIVCELPKSRHPACFTVERPIVVRTSSAVTVTTPCAGSRVLRTIWSPPTHRRDTTHGEPAMREGRPTADSRYPDNNDKMSSLPRGAVDSWYKKWISPGAPLLIVEPTLCRESFQPVLLLGTSGCCQLSN